MKKIRNTLLILMALVMILSAFACKKTDDNVGANGSSSGDANKNTEANESTNEENGEEAPEATDREKENETDGISDLYRVMADKCGLSITDERKKAMIIPLGNAYDQETLKDVLSKLKLWSSKYYDVKDLNKLFMLKKEEGADNTYLMAQEFYIVIPKYKADEISLKELELFENGNLYPVPNDFIDGKSYTGPVLICQNISDIAPNGEICIESESGETKFSPFVSLKDGSLMLPDEIYNAAGILDMKDYDNNDYDEDLFNEIKKYFYYYE